MIEETGGKSSSIRHLRGEVLLRVCEAFLGSESAISKYENDRRGHGRLRQIALVPPKRKFERNE